MKKYTKKGVVTYAFFRI